MYGSSKACICAYVRSFAQLCVHEVCIVCLHITYKHIQSTYKAHTYKHIQATNNYIKPHTTRGFARQGIRGPTFQEMNAFQVTMLLVVGTLLPIANAESQAAGLEVTNLGAGVDDSAYITISTDSSVQKEGEIRFTIQVDGEIEFDESKLALTIGGEPFSFSSFELQSTRNRVLMRATIFFKSNRSPEAKKLDISQKKCEGEAHKANTQ